MGKTITYIEWIVFPLALFAWVAVGYFAWAISTDEADRTALVKITQVTESKGAVAVRLHAIVQDTAAQRAQLDSALRVDVVSVVDMIEAAGKAAGVNIAVSNAQPESAPSPKATRGSQVMATGFAIEAEGKFPALMHAVQLFETLPVPSKLERLDIEHMASTSSRASHTWHMSAYIRVLTTPDVRL